MNPTKRGLCSFFALLCALLSVVSADQVLGPSPPVVYVPVNGTATFTCSYGDFQTMTDAWFWKVNDEELSELDEPEIVIGGANTSRLYTIVSQHSQEPVLVVCELFRRDGKTFHFLVNSTNVSQILTYEKPSSPGNLSVSVSEEELSVSWSSPWSPPGVILNYTVTVLATSNNVKMDYHTAGTTLTVNGADLTREIGVPGLCEQYQVKVVAESPAGIGVASEETVPLFNFTGNINISVCNQSNHFAFSIHLLEPGACYGDTGNYTLLLNTTDGILEADVNFMGGLEALVAVDWNVSSAALGVSTSYGFSRSEFYHFSKEEMAGVCSELSSTVTTSTFLPYPSSIPSPTELSLEPENTPVLMIAVFVGAGFLFLIMMVVVVTVSVFCIYQSGKQRKRNSKQQMKENGMTDHPGSDKQRLSVISATHPIYQMPQDACQEYLNEQERNSRSRRTSTASLLMITKDSFAQLACDEAGNGYTIHEKSRSLPRDSITDISGYSVVPQTLKNEIKRRSSRLNGSTKSHLAKTLPLAQKESLGSSPSAESSPPLPERNHYSLCTAVGETAPSDVPPPVPPPLSAHHMTSNGAPCYNKDLDDPQVYSVPCKEKSKSPSPPPPAHLRPTSSSPTYSFITPSPPVCDHVS